ncbi:MAG: hypothetical protein KDE19_21840 [Caldilineaceae bacterium]|nr:hypothetical protein [Caldilineaceae bacterium]
MVESRAFWTKHRWIFGIIILTTALVLRLWQIWQLPPGFHFDESFEGLEAWRILTDPSYRPLFLTGNFGVPPLNSYLNAVTFGLWRTVGLPVGPVPMRVTAALVGTLSVAALFALAQEFRRLPVKRERLSVAFPFFAAALLALMRWHIHFSRMGIEPIYVPLLWTLAMWLLLRGYRTGHLLEYGGCGIVLAVAMYTYQGAWIIPPLAAAIGLLLLIDAFRRNPPATEEPIAPPKPTRLLLGLVTTGVVAALLVAPLAWFFWQNPDLLLLRPAQLSVVGETASPADSSIADNLWATAKMFGPFGTPGDQDPRRNIPGAPALSPWFALPFYLGLALAVLRFTHIHNAIMLVGLGGLLLLGVLSEYAPHFHRILGAAAPTALLGAVGLDWLWRRRFLRAQVGQWLAILLLLVGGFREAQLYFVQWAALPDLFYAFDVGLWQVGQQIAETPTETPVYLTPRAADHATLAFAWQTKPDAHAPPVTFDGRAIFPLTAGSNPQPEHYVVIEHEDFRTDLLLPGLFPTATVTNERYAPDGTLYAHTFVREAESPIARPPQRYAQSSHQPLPIGDGIHLLGYDIQPDQLTAGGVLYLQLYWLVDAVPTADWTVFVHLLQEDSAGTLQWVAGHDSRPGAGSLPTTAWQSGWQILDEHQLPLPADLPAGAYTPAIGLYQANGEQLPSPGEPLVLESIQVQ